MIQITVSKDGIKTILEKFLRRLIGEKKMPTFDQKDELWGGIHFALISVLISQISFKKIYISRDEMKNRIIHWFVILLQ